MHAPCCQHCNSSIITPEEHFGKYNQTPLLQLHLPTALGSHFAACYPKHSLSLSATPASIFISFPIRLAHLEMPQEVFDPEACTQPLESSSQRSAISPSCHPHQRLTRETGEKWQGKSRSLHLRKEALTAQRYRHMKQPICPTECGKQHREMTTASSNPPAPISSEDTLCLLLQCLLDCSSASQHPVLRVPTYTVCTAPKGTDLPANGF